MKNEKKIQKWDVAKIIVAIAGYGLRKIITTSFGNWLSGKGFQFLVVCTTLAFSLWAVARAVKKYGGKKKLKKIKAVADAYLEEFQVKNIGKSLIDAIIKWLNN